MRRKRYLLFLFFPELYLIQEILQSVHASFHIAGDMAVVADPTVTHDKPDQFFPFHPAPHRDHQTFLLAYLP